MRYMRNINFKDLFKLHFEWGFWTMALILLAFSNPHSYSGPNFCLFEALGFPYCPGHGLGHSIAFTLNGNLSAAFAAHPLGPFALIVLAGRIVKLLHKAFFTKDNFLTPKTSHYG